MAMNGKPGPTRPSNQPIEKAPTGYHLVDMPFAEEATAFDRLSPALREALSEAGFAINAIGILAAWDRGRRSRYAEQEIIKAIRVADERAAIELGTMPGEFWRGRQISMRPEKTDSAAPRPVTRLPALPAGAKVRRLLRARGSY